MPDPSPRYAQCAARRQGARIRGGARMVWRGGSASTVTRKEAGTILYARQDIDAPPRLSTPHVARLTSVPRRAPLRRATLSLFCTETKGGKRHAENRDFRRRNGSEGMESFQVGTGAAAAVALHEESYLCCLRIDSASTRSCGLSGSSSTALAQSVAASSHCRSRAYNRARRAQVSASVGARSIAFE